MLKYFTVWCKRLQTPFHVVYYQQFIRTKQSTGLVFCSAFLISLKCKGNWFLHGYLKAYSLHFMAELKSYIAVLYEMYDFVS